MKKLWVVLEFEDEGKTKIGGFTYHTDELRAISLSDHLDDAETNNSIIELEFDENFATEESINNINEVLSKAINNSCDADIDW